MLHILLTILKILGITILVILGLILALMLIVLFIPIRYRVIASKQEDIVGKIRVSWLLGFVTFIAKYQEKKMDIQLRILGFNLMRLLNSEKKPKKKIKGAKTKEAIQDAAEEKKDNKELSKNTPVIETFAKKPDDFEEEAIPEKKKKVPFKEKLSNIKNNVQERIEKIKLTIQNICGKIRYWKEFIADSRVKKALGLVKNKLIKIIKHILPKRFSGEVIYGFEDPCQTGQVLAGISVLYLIYYKHLNVIPDFSGSVLKGNTKIKGRIYLGYLLITSVSIIFDKNIQYIIHTFRNKEGSQDGK